MTGRHTRLAAMLTACALQIALQLAGAQADLWVRVSWLATIMILAATIWILEGKR